jgi:hypothetical protein
MAYKLQIVDKQNSLNFNVRYENLAKGEKPDIEAKAPNGKVVKERLVYQNKVLQPGDTQRRWVDDVGQFYSKGELVFTYQGEQVQEIQQTKVFEIEGFQPIQNYTDRYVISAYYEVFPDDNGMKKDFEKDKAIKANLYQMRKLWEYLDANQVVARGEFNTSSKGFMAGDGYVRAIKINGTRWGLEIGVFKEEKIFQHIQEGIPEAVSTIQTQTGGKKLKRV